MLRNAKVGDFVFSARFGWGEVISIDTETDYPVMVRFKQEECKCTFTLDGKNAKFELCPTCFTKENTPCFYLEMCPPPKKMIKKKIKFFINIYDGCVFAHSTKEKAICDAGISPDAVAVECFAEYEVEEK